VGKTARAGPAMSAIVKPKKRTGSVLIVSAQLRRSLAARVRRHQLALQAVSASRDDDDAGANVEAALGAIRGIAANFVRQERRDAQHNTAARSADGVPRALPAGSGSPVKPADAVAVMGSPDPTLEVGPAAGLLLPIVV
jgi:hypothetical protein